MVSPPPFPPLLSLRSFCLSPVCDLILFCFLISKYRISDLTLTLDPLNGKNDGCYEIISNEKQTNRPFPKSQLKLYAHGEKIAMKGY